MLKQQLYDYSVDWWAFGVLCFELITGFYPFQGKKHADIIKNILFRNIDDSINNINSEETKSFLNGLLEEN